jgi:polyphosphate glucokinase
MTNAAPRSAVGIDIGGTGIKGAVVDLTTGALLTDRVKIPTPKGGEPKDIVVTVREVLEQLSPASDGLPLGVCFPAIVRNGRTMSAANVSDAWIGLEAEQLFEQGLGREITFVNDADAAGYAETEFGAAKGASGLTILTTLGTGIGTALINDGVLIVNSELGHLEIDGHDAESRASDRARTRDDLSWEQWAERLQRYFETVEYLFSPDLIVVGGGVSKHHEKFLPLLDLRAPIIPAKLRNAAGIVGAARLAADAD